MITRLVLIICLFICRNADTIHTRQCAQSIYVFVIVSGVFIRLMLISVVLSTADIALGAVVTVGALLVFVLLLCTMICIEWYVRHTLLLYTRALPAGVMISALDLRRVWSLALRICHHGSIIRYRSQAVMPCEREGNRRSGVALAMRHRLKWFIHLRVQDLKNGDEHLAYTPL